jgi:hypothetical protein
MLAEDTAIAIPPRYGAIRLWQFPPEDFAAFRELYGPDAHPTYASYDRFRRAFSNALRQQGRMVETVTFGVAEMKERLTDNGWPNDSHHRAMVIQSYTTTHPATV